MIVCTVCNDSFISSLFHNILNWTGILAMLQIYRNKWFCNNDFLAILQQYDSVE